MPDDIDNLNRKSRRAAAKTEGALDTMAFLKLADKFIDVANRENRNIKASDVHMAFLFAAARYNAHVAKNVLDVDNHEVFVKEMAEQYKEMLRQHLGDESLEPKQEKPAAKPSKPEDFLAD
ncbi:MAG: hypothetical protein APF80_07565 [Alphaproteobacteria bacterium BRH_c36]|nr:MAG: hypothetical protein APF80_07565 [Alphaproteobacteria bacterium BRH_c36]